MKDWKRISIDFAEVLDALRVFPRLFVMLYIYGLSHVLYWATSLPDISVQQAAFISVVSGTFPFVLNFYMQTGRAWGNNQGVNNVQSSSDVGNGQGGGGFSNPLVGGGAISSTTVLRSEVQGNTGASRNVPQSGG